MSKVVLIRLWIAQGFFGYTDRSDLEKFGEDHFRILAERSFFQDFNIDSNGNITHCKMHDLVHDFAMYLSQNESYYLKGRDTIFDSDKIRHLYAITADFAYISKAKSLRTLLLRYKWAVPIELFAKLTCLRTLDMSYCGLEVLPNEVENLVHLRYLDLSGTKLLELPETVCNLYNLQFLGLKECEKLHKLPEKIGKLCNLRHLDIKGTDSLSHIPKSLAMLSSLRSLSNFIVSGGDCGCKIGDLRLLKNLGGVLELKGLSQVTDEEDATQADLKKKQYLWELRFDFNAGEGSGVRIGMKNVLDKLELHEDLEILEIRDYSDPHFPGWFQDCSSLANVVEIRLIRCNGCTKLPPFGELAHLKSLVIEGMNSVIRISQEFYGSDSQKTAFLKLESLVIKKMEKLEEWEVPISKHRKIMPLLRDIELRKCPMLRVLPSLGRLESLEKLLMRELDSVKYIGKEFYGFDDGDSSLGAAFPKLRELAIEYLCELEEWEIPTSKEDRKIMPFLSKLKLMYCFKLRALPRVWRMEALEELEWSSLNSVKGGVGVEFADGDNEDVGGVTFPKLTRLYISYMRELEEWSVPLITPCLKKLQLCDLPKLKRLPTFHGCVETLESLEIKGMDSWEGQEKIVINEREGDSCVALRSLKITNCPELGVVPDHLFSPSIVKLELWGDVGVLFHDDSFSDYANKLCSITRVSLWDLPYSCLPKGFHQLKTLEWLDFDNCQTLDFDLKELAHFTQLRNLEINYCPLLTQRFEGDDWRSILAHLPKITLDYTDIKKQS